jgi:cytochrome c oxidase subunit IV
VSESHSHDISKHVKIYRAVGAALIVGTIVTVAAANVRFGIAAGIIVALVIAIVKGSLVAGYFMHLFSERKLIYGVLGLTVAFVIAMVGLIMFAYRDQQGHARGAFLVPQQHVVPHHPEPEAGAEHVP